MPTGLDGVHGVSVPASSALRTGGSQDETKRGERQRSRNQGRSECLEYLGKVFGNK